MAIVFKPPKGRSVPTGKVRIDWSHPLAQGLIGCWLPGVSQGIDLTGKSAPLTTYSLAAGGNPFSVATEGPSYSDRDPAKSNMLSGPATPEMLTWRNQQLSYYYRADRNGTTTPNWPYFFYISYNSTGGAPYMVTGIQSISGDFGYGQVQWNSGGTGTVTSQYDFSAAGTISALVTQKIGGNTVFYNKGVVLETKAFGASAPTFGTAPQVSINGWKIYDRYSSALPYLACIWDRELSADEARFLDLDPYCFLISDEGELPQLPFAVSPNLGASGGGGSVGNPPKDLAVPNGLTAYWPLSYETVNLVSNKAETIIGDRGFPIDLFNVINSDRRDTITGGGIAFDGGNRSALTAIPALTSAELSSTSVKFTFTAWVNASALTSTHLILTVGRAGYGSIAYLGYRSDQGNKFVFTADTSTFAVSNAVPSTGRDYFLAGVASANAAGGVTLYVDGIAQTSKGSTVGTDATAPDTTTIAVTSSGSGGALFAGTVSECRIYNRALDASEIQELYHTGLRGRRDRISGFSRRELPALFLPSVGGPSTGSAAGVGTAAAIGSSTASSQGAAAGVGSASAVGTGILLAQGAASGTGTANGISGAITSSAVGAAAGIGTAAAIGTGIKTSQGTAVGTGIAAAIGSAIVTSIGTSSGTGIAAGIAGGTFFGAASGVGSAQAFGLVKIAAQGAAAGVGTAQAFGLAAVTATGTAAGIGIAQAFQFVPVSSAQGTASGFGIAIGIGGSFRAPPVAPVPYPSKYDYGWYDRMPPIRGKGRR